MCFFQTEELQTFLSRQYRKGYKHLDYGDFRALPNSERFRSIRYAS